MTVATFLKELQDKVAGNPNNILSKTVGITVVLSDDGKGHTKSASGRVTEIEETSNCIFITAK